MIKISFIFLTPQKKRVAYTKEFKNQDHKNNYLNKLDRLGYKVIGSEQL